MNYEEWNGCLVHHFFNPAQSGKRVYLQTTSDLLQQLADSPSGAEDFVAVVKQGPSGAPGSLCEKALFVFHGWRDRKEQFPPYLAHLCIFSLAAGRGGDWAAHAYYPRLWDLLGEAQSGHPPHFYEMKQLWRDLEVWTRDDQRGSLGVFQFQTFGKWQYVGLPVAQIVLTEVERKILPAIFADADIEPGATLAEDLLPVLVATASHGRLRGRSLAALQNPDWTDYRTALVEAIQTELTDWDGRTPAVPEDTTSTAANPRAGIRIWISSIDAAGFATTRLVVAVREGMEPEDLALMSSHLPGMQFRCQTQSAVFSGALEDCETGKDLSAETVPWNARMEFRCQATGYRMVLGASRIRLFTSAAQFGIKGFIEIQRLPSHGTFFLAAEGNEAERVATWGMGSCIGWKEVRPRSGFPPQWHLFRADGLDAGGEVGAPFPVLERPRTPRIVFQGGIKVGRSGAFFPFALPRIAIEWPFPPTAITCNGTPLAAVDEYLYSLEGLALSASNLIDAQFGTESVQAMLFLQFDGWSWREGQDCPVNNILGNAAGAVIRIQGASVDGDSPPEFMPDPGTSLAGEKCAFLLGRIPGQIADLRHGNALPTWEPVWAVSTRRREVRFSFCGTDLKCAAPLAGPRLPEAKRWASEIWHNRKRCVPPKHPKVRALLRAYQEVANV